MKLVCWWLGEHAIVSRLETIDGKLVWTQDYCKRCDWKTPRLPGGMVDLYRQWYLRAG